MNVTSAYASWETHKDDALLQAVRHTRLPLSITDPTLDDNPLVYVNQAFTDLTGYTAEEVIGRNCRFLQGAGTSRASIDEVQKMLRENELGTVEILNYRKDGSAFINALQIGPIYDAHGKVVLFFGAQMDVTAQRHSERQSRDLADRELLHRLRNIVNVMSVIVRMTAHEEKDPAAFGRKTLDRLTALSEVHFTTLLTKEDARPDLATAAHAILLAYAPLRGDHFRLSGPDTALPKSLLTPLTLVLHELAANAVKHGALSTSQGAVSLRWEKTGQDAGQTLVLHWQERGGPKVSAPENPSGSKIITALVATIGGTLTLDWNPDGLRARAVFPLRD